MLTDRMEKITRIIQESVPGKQITLVHVIAAPIRAVYDSLGISHKGAIGILALTPYETAIIATDIAGKAADVEICFVDRFTGSVIFSGDLQSVETALKSIVDYFKTNLDFTVVPLTRS
ncbi:MULTISPECIES: BMC domain-containing protein [unclassified Streptococcus]|uniref:BMC domain-containing protein n=1 Tax=unclassified Streptococcus TaxID=2608887 RepID=UPI001071BA9D|nr:MULTISPECIES: BMC domain-containing protein [unclassified Streptococcus]MBF0786417.1 BMC domain-containing protein [Streptococcus sp. 19428wC2_LYSM12]MCQ9212524.1 BMC domain-containing protein [Streptococcus sp. B01]MCQ9213863.1 BMC domain-containing protein [Streptococcus sp. O1]TFV06825.1 BMC domain-containing protein [Streptococcus sp. LYSM12]